MLPVKFFAAILILLMSATIWAAGTMQLSGQVHSFDSETIDVTDGQHIYKLKRTAVYNKAPLAKNLKVGQQVEVTVAVEGIVETKEVKKKK